MVRKIPIALCCLITTLACFAGSEEDQIASACKPYLQQYKPNTNPNQLPAAAQKALQACQANNSCANPILSDPQTGIPDCAVKLQNSQPRDDQLIIVSPQPNTQPALPTKPKSFWHYGAPDQQQQQQQQQQPADSSTNENDTSTTAAPAPVNTNNPISTTPDTAKPQKTQPSINWL